MRKTISLLALMLTACATANVNEPSLARRPAEAIDPRVPVPSNPVPGPVDAALAARLGALVAEGKAATAQFQAEVGWADSLAAAAGPAQSESWVVAQEALSRLEAARSRTARALTQIDDLASDRVKASGGISPSDLAAIEASLAELGAIVDRQASEMSAIAARLAR